VAPPQFVDSTVFAYFPRSECGQRSAALAVNPSQTDFNPPVTMSNIKYVSVDDGAMFALGRSDTTAGECKNAACDSYGYTMVLDKDGTVTGIRGRCGHRRANSADSGFFIHTTRFLVPHYHAMHWSTSLC
jgi:hypothetical protein